MGKSHNSTNNISVAGALSKLRPRSASTLRSNPYLSQPPFMFTFKESGDIPPTHLYISMIAPLSVYSKTKREAENKLAEILTAEKLKGAYRSSSRVFVGKLSSESDREILNIKPVFDDLSMPVHVVTWESVPPNPLKNLMTTGFYSAHYVYDPVDKAWHLLGRTGGGPKRNRLYKQRGRGDKILQTQAANIARTVTEYRKDMFTTETDILEHRGFISLSDLPRR